MNTGGQAFPTIMAYEVEKGMTLRDYFAAKAMQGLLFDNVSMVTAAKSANVAVEEGLAFVAYRIADKMIAERDK